MACMEHFCVKCGWSTFDNSSGSLQVCPKCGGDLNHCFDEDNDDDDE